MGMICKIIVYVCGHMTFLMTIMMVIEEVPVPVYSHFISSFCSTLESHWACQEGHRSWQCRELWGSTAVVWARHWLLSTCAQVYVQCVDSTCFSLSLSLSLSLYMTWFQLCVFADCCISCVHSTDQKHGERAKDSLRGKISQYLERAEQLKKFLAKGKSKTHTSGGQAAKEKKK